MKKLLLITLSLVMALTLCFGLTACNDKIVEQISNELGVLLEGGNFKEGSVLNINDITAEKATEIIGKLEENGIAIDDATKTYIYDIFVSKDNAEVQPDGKVKVTVPMPADEKATGYNVYHMKDSGAVELIPSTYKDGKVSFETDSFSWYVFTPTYNYVGRVILDSDVTGIVVDVDNTVVYDPNGDTPLPNFESVRVTAVAPNGTFALSADKYTVDLGGLDTAKPGSYTVTYTYNKNTDIKATVTVVILKKAVKITVENYGWGGHTDVLGEILVEKGEEVTINAYLEDEERFIFSGWYQNDFDTRVAGAMTYTFTATEDTVLIARFERDTTIDLNVRAICMGEVSSDLLHIMVEGIELKDETMEEITRQLHPGRIIHLEALSEAENFKFLGWYMVQKDEEPMHAIYRTPVSKEALYVHHITRNDIDLIALFANDSIHSNAFIAGGESVANLMVNGSGVGGSTGLRLGETYVFDVALEEDYKFLYWEVRERNTSYIVEDKSFTYEVIPGSREVVAICEPVFVDMKMAYGKDEYTFKAGEDVFAQLQSVDVLLFMPSGNSMWSTYGQTHTIDFADLDTSTVGTYVITYECLNNPDILAKVTVHIISTEISLNLSVKNGVLMVDGEEIGPDYCKTFADGYGKVTLTAKGNENTVFKGWYVVDGNTTKLISTETTVTIEIEENTTVYAEFKHDVIDLVVDMDDVTYYPDLLKQYTLIGIPEFIAICKEGKTGENWNTEYMVVGTIKSISNTTWGNMYIADGEGNELHLYGVYDENGTRYGLLNSKPRVGDTIAVHGTPYLYNNHPEMQKAYLLNEMPVLPDFENVTVSSVTADGTTKLSADEFTVDASAVNPDKPGEYAVVYTYKANPEIKATVTVKVIASPVCLNAWVNGGTILIDGVDVGPDYFEEFTDGFGKVTLTAKGYDNTVFKGWYTNNGNDQVLVSTDETFTVEINEDSYYYAEYEYIASEILLNCPVESPFYNEFGFVEIWLPLNDPDTNFDLTQIEVFYISEDGLYNYLDYAEGEYTIDAGGFDANNILPGDYTVTFIYARNPEVKATLPIRVLDEENMVSLDVSAEAGGRVTADKPYQYYNKGTEMTVTVELRSEKDYEFLGWYRIVFAVTEEDCSETLVSTDRTYSFTLDDSMILVAKIEPKITRLEVEGLEENPMRIPLAKFEAYADLFAADRGGIYACGALGKRVELTAGEYTVDLGGLDVSNPAVGKYTVTYTYKADPSITYSVAVWVWDEDHSFRAYTNSPDCGSILFEGGITADAGGQYIDGEEITVTALEREGFTFLGWYKVINKETHEEFELITTEQVYTFVIEADTTIMAKFDSPVTEIWLDGVGFSNQNGKNVINVYRGEKIHIGGITVYGMTFMGYDVLSADDYTVDLGGLDPDNPVAGSYVITYTYKENTELTACIYVTVMAPTYVVKVEQYHNPGYVSGAVEYEGNKHFDLFLEVEEGKTVILKATEKPNFYFVGWYATDYNHYGEWEIYSTDTTVAVKAERDIILAPAYMPLIVGLQMHLRAGIYEAGVMGYDFSSAEFGHWDEELRCYVARGHIDLYANSEYATDIERLFENFNIIAVDSNGRHKQISHADLTFDLDENRAEEDWYELTVSYSSFTMIVNVMVIPAENA